MQKVFIGFQFLARRDLCLGAVLLVSILLSPWANAQQEGAPAAKGGDAVEVKRFADTWRSNGKAVNRPYRPIQPSADQGLIPEIDMFVGETRVFPAPGLARIAVGNGDIMSAASLDDKEVIVFANAVGTSSLFIWNQDGRHQRVKINIVAGDTSRFAREIAAFLSGIPRAKASVIGDKVIVEGDDLSDQDLDKITELSKRYPQIVNFTNRVGWDQMVLMDVKVVEFPTNLLREAGLKWTATGGMAIGGIWAPTIQGRHVNEYQINLLTGQGNPAPISASGGGTEVPLHARPNFLGVVNMGLNAQLALLSQEGKAAILAEPQLSTRNGSKATFLAGGEYPYTVTTLNGPTVQFKPFGVKLDIVPQVARNGIVRATIDTEVSAIDTSISTTAGPALSSRRTTTEFNVRSGETLVLAGLLSRKNSTSIDKVPFLGDIPVIGALFRSTRFQNDETELAVFVTPWVVDSRSPGLVDRVERATRRLEEITGRDPYLNAPDVPLPKPAQPGGESHLDPDRGESRASAEPVAAAMPVTPTTGERVTPVQEHAPINRRVLSEGEAVYELPNRMSIVLVRVAKDAVLEGGRQDMVGEWRQVRLPDGAVGWISDHAAAATTDAPRLVLASGESHPTARAATGEADRMVAQPVTPVSDGEGAPGRWYRVNRSKLAFRVSPDINAQRIDWLPEATEVEALSGTNAEGWLPVRYEGRQGWVWAQGLALLGAEAR